VNVIIFGPSTQVGVELIAHALERGHRVTAFARDPEYLENRDPRLTLARGDVLDGASLRAGLAGQEAALSALSIRRGAGGLLLAEGVANLVQALTGAGVRRFICLSPTYPGTARSQLGWLRRVFRRPPGSRAGLAEQAVIERYIRSSALDWKIVQPAGQISSDEVSRFMLDELENPRHLCQVVSLD
jgi:putative NADH-flavin reductase